MYKVVWMLLLISGLRLLASCCKETGFPFHWTKASLRHVTLQGNGWVSNSSDSASRETAGFVLRFEHERLAIWQPQVFGISPAMATKCRTSFENRDTINSIQVLTRFGFDASHPAGSSLNDLPLVREFAYPAGSPNAYQRPASIIHGPSGLNATRSPYSMVVFAFGATKPFAGQHRFVVRMITSSGRMLEDSVSFRLY